MSHGFAALAWQPAHPGVLLNKSIEHSGGVFHLMFAENERSCLRIHENHYVGSDQWVGVIWLAWRIGRVVGCCGSTDTAQRAPGFSGSFPNGKGTRRVHLRLPQWTCRSMMRTQYYGTTRQILNQPRSSVAQRRIISRKSRKNRFPFFFSNK